MKKVHLLKTWPVYYQAILDGDKTFEARHNDRDFQQGDWLKLREWEPDDGYTGRALFREVTYVLYGGQFGIEAGWCVMGLRLPEHPIQRGAGGSAAALDAAKQGAE